MSEAIAVSLEKLAKSKSSAEMKFFLAIVTFVTVFAVKESSQKTSSKENSDLELKLVHIVCEVNNKNDLN